MNKLKFLLFVLFVQSTFQPARSQSLINLRSTLSAGASSSIQNASGKLFSVQQSIGQSSVIDTYKAGGYTLRQGFIQPLKGYGESTSVNILQATVSPNPFLSNVAVSFSEAISENLYVTLYNVFGQRVFYNEYKSTQELNLDFGQFQSGVYVIKVNTSRKHLTAKLIKE